MRLFTEMKPDGEMALVRYVIRTLSELSHLRRSLTNTAKIEIEIKRLLTSTERGVVNN